jgi:hypothetical protein
VQVLEQTFAVTFRKKGVPKVISGQLEILPAMTMSVEAEQQVAAAARLQLTWHYARLLTTTKYRQDALLRAELGPKSEEEVQAIQAELAAWMLTLRPFAARRAAWASSAASWIACSMRSSANGGCWPRWWRPSFEQRRAPAVTRAASTLGGASRASRSVEPGVVNNDVGAAASVSSTSTRPNVAADPTEAAQLGALARGRLVTARGRVASAL